MKLSENFQKRNRKFAVSLLLLISMFSICGAILNAQDYYITGPSLVCTSGEYTVQNAGGATIVWSSSSNVTRVSAQGSNPATFSENGNGNATITATIYCGGKSYIRNASIWVGPPIIEYITAESGDTGSAGTSSAFAVWPGPNHISQPANLSPSVSPSANIWYNSAMYIQIYFQNSGNYSIWATTENGCGTSSPVYYWEPFPVI